MSAFDFVEANDSEFDSSCDQQTLLESMLATSEEDVSPRHLTPWLLRGGDANRSKWRLGDAAKIFVLIVLTVADGVLVTILFDKYGDRYSQYLNQGTAGVYVVVSTTMVLVRWCWSGKDRTGGKTDKPAVPAWILITIGILNGSGNFFMATSQPHTPGLSQSLLNQLTIPLVLVLSFVCLRKRSSLVGCVGAALIVGGTAISAFRPGGESSSCGENTCYAVSTMLYAVAQIFLSAERVFEEHTFKNRAADVLTMFCWTLWTQFFLGFALYPAQTKEPFGNLEMNEIPNVIWVSGFEYVSPSDVTLCSDTSVVVFRSP